MQTRPPFAKRLTSRDLARLAGVSQTTVSRVFARDPKVTPETAQHVLSVARSVGYAPNFHASAMRSGRSNTVGLLVNRITNPLHAALVDALGHELLAAGFEVMLWNTELGGDEATLKAVQQRNIDGIIVGSAAIEGALEKQVFAHGTPIVLVHRGVPGLQCDQVLGDNVGGAGMIAAYFARAGRKRVAVILARGVGTAARDRVEGFMAAARQAAMTVDVVHRGSHHKDGAAAAIELLRRRPAPQAIFAGSDLLALGAFDGARSIGVAIPDDVWIAGFDNIDMTSWHSYRLTTVDEPVRDMARIGVDLLRKRMAGSTAPPEMIRLPCTIEVRHSTDYFEG